MTNYNIISNMNKFCKIENVWMIQKLVRIDTPKRQQNQANWFVFWRFLLEFFYGMVVWNPSFMNPTCTWSVLYSLKSVCTKKTTTFIKSNLSTCK